MILKEHLISPARLARYLGVERSLISVWVARGLLPPDYDLKNQKIRFNLRVIDRLVPAYAREDLGSELDEPKAALIEQARRIMRKREAAPRSPGTPTR